jgi:hypothetical protein
MLTDRWRTHGSLFPRRGHGGVWPNPQRSHEAAPSSCPHAQTLMLPSYHMRRWAGSALYRQSRWHGNCSLESKKAPYRSCSHPEREESRANIRARGRHGRHGPSCSIILWLRTAWLQGSRRGASRLPWHFQGQRWCTVPPLWKRPPGQPPGGRADQQDYHHGRCSTNGDAHL